VRSPADDRASDRGDAIAGEGEEAGAQASDTGAAKSAAEAAERIPAPVVTLARPSDLEVRYQGVGLVTTSAAGSLVVLEEDYRHLHAIDPKSGAVRWRVEAQEAPKGRHDLYARGDRVLLHAGDRLVLVDAASGRRIGEAPAVFNSAEGECRVQIQGNACAYACSCSIQLFDCDTGARRGPGFWSSENHIYFEEGKPHDSVCPIRPQLLGPAGELTVALVEGADGRTGAVGVDRRGEIRWQRDGIIKTRGTFGAGSRAAGIADDGRVCWAADRYGGELEVFSCDTGKRLWTRPVEVAKTEPEALRQMYVRWLPIDGGRLWIEAIGADGGTVEVREPETGRRIWAQKIEAGSRPWPLGRSLAGAYLPAPMTLRFFDGGRGDVVRKIELEEGARIIDDPRGGFFVLGDGIVEYDAQAKIRRQRPRSLQGVPRLTPAHVIVRLEKALEVLRREDLSPSVRIDGEVSLLETPGLDPEIMVVVGYQAEGANDLLIVGPRTRRTEDKDTDTDTDTDKDTE